MDSSVHKYARLTTLCAVSAVALQLVGSQRHLHSWHVCASTRLFSWGTYCLAEWKLSCKSILRWECSVLVHVGCPLEVECTACEVHLQPKWIRCWGQFSWQHQCWHADPTWKCPALQDWCLVQSPRLVSVCTSYCTAIWWCKTTPSGHHCSLWSTAACARWHQGAFESLQLAGLTDSSFSWFPKSQLCAYIAYIAVSCFKFHSAIAMLTHVNMVWYNG